MPRYDGTGPAGQGSGAGWGRGPCGAGRGMGSGRGAGRGFGFRRFWGGYSAPSEKEETGMLSENENILEEELRAIKSRLAQLKSKNK